MSTRSQTYQQQIHPEGYRRRDVQPSIDQPPQAEQEEKLAKQLRAHCQLTMAFSTQPTYASAKPNYRINNTRNHPPLFTLTQNSELIPHRKQICSLQSIRQ